MTSVWGSRQMLLAKLFYLKVLACFQINNVQYPEECLKMHALC